MKQARSRLSLRTAATTPSGAMNTLLRAGLGGALLALTAACSGDMDGGLEGIEGEVEDQGSEVVDVFDSAAMPEPAGVIEKATFADNATINGFNVVCTDEQKTLIRAAEARAREILAIAMPANADARVNRTTGKGPIFKLYLIPNGNSNPDPNRTRPDAWDTATSRAGQKMVGVSGVLASAVHTCHGGNETLGIFGGEFRTCNQIGASAATNSVAVEGLAANTVRWCELGLAGSLNVRAVSLLHELTHQDRTNDVTGGHVFDDGEPGLYNAQSWSNWYNNNQRP